MFAFYRVTVLCRHENRFRSQSPDFDMKIKFCSNVDMFAQDLSAKQVV